MNGYEIVSEAVNVKAIQSRQWQRIRQLEPMLRRASYKKLSPGNKEKMMKLVRKIKSSARYLKSRGIKDPVHAKLLQTLKG